MVQNVANGWVTDVLSKESAGKAKVLSRCCFAAKENLWDHGTARPATPPHWAARIIPDFSQTTQGVKGFSDPVSLKFSSND